MMYSWEGTPDLIKNSIVLKRRDGNCSLFVNSKFSDKGVAWICDTEDIYKCVNQTFICFRSRSEFQNMPWSYTNTMHPLNEMQWVSINNFSVITVSFRSVNFAFMFLFLQYLLVTFLFLTSQNAWIFTINTEHGAVNMGTNDIAKWQQKTGNKDNQFCL